MFDKWAAWARRRITSAIMARAGSNSAHVGWFGGIASGLGGVGHELRGPGSAGIEAGADCNRP